MVGVSSGSPSRRFIINLGYVINRLEAGGCISDEPGVERPGYCCGLGTDTVCTVSTVGQSQVYGHASLFFVSCCKEALYRTAAFSSLIRPLYVYTTMYFFHRQGE